MRFIRWALQYISELLYDPDQSPAKISSPNAKKVHSVMHGSTHRTQTTSLKTAKCFYDFLFKSSQAAEEDLLKRVCAFFRISNHIPRFCFTHISSEQRDYICLYLWRTGSMLSGSSCISTCCDYSPIRSRNGWLKLDANTDHLACRHMISLCRLCRSSTLNSVNRRVN